MRVLLLAGLALTGTTSAQSAVADDADIVVIARKVAQVSMTLGRDSAGRTRCSLTRSSGDTRIDEAMCRRASRCMKPGMTAAVDVDTCIARQRKALTRAWAKGARS